MYLQKAQNFFLYLYVFSLVFENWDMMSFGGNSLPKFIGYVLFLLILVDKNLYSIRQIKRFLIPLGGFLLALLISIIINLDETTGYFWLFQTIFLNVLLFSLVSLIIVKRPDTGEKMFFALNAGILLSVFFYMLGFGVELTLGRLTIFGVNQNSLGIFSVISILFILSLVFENPHKYGRLRYLLLLFFVPLLNMVALSGSRVTFLGLMISLGLFFLLRRSKNMIRKFIIFLIGAVVITLIFNYLMDFDVLQSRMSSTLEEGHISGRDRIWEIWISEIIKNPIFGIGVNGYLKISQYYFGGFYSPHNVFLELLAFSGIIGLFFFLLFYYRISRLAWMLIKLKNYLLPFVLLAFIFFIFFSGQGLGNKPFWVVYLFAMGEYLKYKKPNADENKTPIPIKE